jgi:hypothetical protein
MKESIEHMKDRINWRRNKVSELSIKGYTQADISRTLQISEATISRNIEYLREEAKQSIKEHITDKIPFKYKKCIMGLENIIKECYIIADNCNTNKDKLQSLALIKDTYNTKMDLLTNASLLQDSIKFVEQNKDKISPVNFSEVNDKKGVMEFHHKVQTRDLENDLQGSTEDSTAGSVKLTINL